MHKFSVLLSVYHAEDPKFLEASLKSIYFDQTLKPNEIILVKDGILTSDLDSVINDFKLLSPLKIISFPTNQGLGKALDFGLKNCSNEIVFRMDTDDISVPDRFEKQIKYFKETDQSIVIVGSNIEEFKNNPYDLKRIRLAPTQPYQINKKKYFRNPFNHMTVGYKKSIILKKGGYKHMPGYEDYYLWMRVLKDYKGINLNDCLVNARVGNNMISRRQGLVFFMNELRFQLKLLKEGLIPFSFFIINFFLRVMPRLLPIQILTLIYNNFLRK